MLSELWKVILKVAEEQGTDEVLYSLAILYAPVIVVAVIAGWLLGRWNTYSTIRKVHADSEKTRTETRLKYQELLAAVDERQQKLNAHKWQLDELLKDVREILKKNRKRILVEARDSLCSFYSNEYVPAFEAYVTLCQQVLPTSELRLRARGEFLPALETQIGLVSAINSEHFLERIDGAAKYKMRRDTIDVLFTRVRSGLSLFDLKRRRKLKKIRKRWEAFVREE